MGRLSKYGKRIPKWMNLYNEKYQIRTVLRLNELLEKAGMNQKELADRAGWNEGYVSRILSGQQNITLKTLARLEAAIGMDALQVTSSSVYPSGMQPMGSCKLISKSGPEFEVNWRLGRRRYAASVKKYVRAPDGDEEFVEVEAVSQ